MKITGHKSCLRAGFTFTELLVVMALLMVVLASVLVAHLTGMRMFQITKAKLGANQDARKAISRLTDEVRSAKWLVVGFGSANGFEQIPDDSAQHGNAIQIYSTPGVHPYIRYYLDTNDHQLKRVTSALNTPEVIAHSISNRLVFTSEDATGVVLTNSENNRVVGLTLSFYQIQYPIVKIGPGELYDFYQLRTRITRRSLE